MGMLAEEMVSTQNSCTTWVIGLGVTGLSCARFFAKQGTPFCVFDTRQQPPGLEELRRELPEVSVYLESLNAGRFGGAQCLVVSPGISLKEPVLTELADQDVQIIGDIELFAREAKAPVVAITGSNGKSTVTTLLGEMASRAGRKVKVGGNLGVPALDLLDDDVDLYVLELSSFQLETTTSLAPKASVILNVSPDHLDRYGGMQEYILAKARIYHNTDYAVVNADDPVVSTLLVDGEVSTFSLHQPDVKGFGILQHDGQEFLGKNKEPILAVDEMKMRGRANVANALAALALGEAVNLPMDAMCEVLRDFSGLPHRMQVVDVINDVTWINDSKGTNVGATAAAIEGLTTPVILIAGGIAKQDDFSALDMALKNKTRAVILFGRDAQLIRESLSDSIPTFHADDLMQAVNIAAQQAQQGDTVLFSPACASFDMFNNFVERGEAFIEAVEGVKNER